MNSDNGALHFDALINKAPFLRDVDALERRVNGFATNTVNETSRVETSFSRLGVAAASFLSLQAAQGFVKSLVDVRGEFQQLEVAFTTMLKSKSAADQLMKEVVDLAATTPFKLQEVASGAKQLLAYGTSAKDITSTLTMLGNVASGVSVPINDIIYLYGTLQTQGRAYTRDIMQFTGRGIPIIDELAKIFGVTKDKVSELVEAGKVGFPEIQKAFQNMTGDAGMFNNLMQEQSKTITGLISNFGDQWDQMLNDLGRSNQGLIADSISGATELVENYEKVLDTIGLLIGTYGAYRAALIVTAAHQKLMEANTVGYVATLNQESVSKIASAQASAAALRIEVSALAAKKAAALEAATLDKAALVAATEKLAAAKASQAASALDIYSSTRAADAKAVQVASEELLAIKEKASVSRKIALSAVTDFNAKKTELETVAKVANSAATVELTAVESLNAAGKNILARAQALYNAALAASPIVMTTLAITALGVAIYSLTQITDAATEAQEKLNDAKTEGYKASEKERTKIQDLISVIKSQNSSIEQKSSAYQKLQEITNGSLKQYSQEDIAAGKARGAIDDLVVSIKEATAAKKAFADADDLKDQIAELEINGIKAVDTWTKIGRSIRNVLTPTSQGLSFNDWLGLFGNGGETNDKLIVSQEMASRQKQIDAINKKFGGRKNSILTGVDDKSGSSPILSNKQKVDAAKNLDEVKALLESFQKDYSAANDDGNRERLASDINYAKKRQANLNKYLEDIKKQQKEENELLKKQNEFKAELLNKENEVKRKGLTSDEEEIKAAQDRYDALRKKAKDLKLGSGVITRINVLEKSETGDIKYRQETEKLEQELEKQKQLYDDFEQYKLTFGLDKAKQRFSGEIDLTKSFLQRLEEERDKVLINDDSGFGLTLSGPEIERVTELNKRIQEQKQLIEKANIEAQVAAQTHNERLLSIDAEYKAKVKALGDNATAAQIAELQRIRREKVQAENASSLEVETNWSNMFASFERMSTDSVMKYLELIRKRVEADRAAGKISEAEYLNRIQAINNANKQFVTGTANPFKNVSNALKGWRNNVDEFGQGSLEAKSSFKDLAGTVSEAAGAVNSILGDISGLMGQLGASEETQQTMDQVMGLVGGVGQLAAGIATGNPIDIIKGSIATLTNAIALFNTKDKKIQKQIQEYQNQLKDLQKSYENIERSISNSVGESYYQDSEQAIKNLRQQAELYQKSIDAERDKKKTDQGKIDEWQAALDSIPNQIEDINKQVTEMLIQTSFKDFSNSLADAFSEAFAAGEDAAGRFDNAFNNVIKNAVKNSLKLKFIEPVVNRFTDSLAEYMKGNNNNVAGFNFDYWKSILKSAGDNMTASLQGFQEFFKQETDVSDSAGLSANKISAQLTEETGTELKGLWRGTYDLTKQIRDFSKEDYTVNKSILDNAIIQVTLLKSIDTHTGNTVNRLDTVVEKLDQVVKNTSGQSGRGSGIVI